MWSISRARDRRNFIPPGRRQERPLNSYSRARDRDATSALGNSGSSRARSLCPAGKRGSRSCNLEKNVRWKPRGPTFRARRPAYLASITAPEQPARPTNTAATYSLHFHPTRGPYPHPRARCPLPLRWRSFARTDHGASARESNALRRAVQQRIQSIRDYSRGQYGFSLSPLLYLAVSSQVFRFAGLRPWINARWKLHFICSRR